MADISTLSTEELKQDRAATLEDINCCQIALAQRITYYSGGSVEQRYRDNRRILSIIENELLSRGESLV